MTLGGAAEWLKAAYTECHGSKPIHGQCNCSMSSKGGPSPVCGVCMFHEWYKTKSHACGKPRLLQATLLHVPESHNMRHLPKY